MRWQRAGTGRNQPEQVKAPSPIDNPEILNGLQIISRAGVRVHGIELEAFARGYEEESARLIASAEAPRDCSEVEERRNAALITADNEPSGGREGASFLLGKAGACELWLRGNSCDIAAPIHFADVRVLALLGSPDGSPDDQLDVYGAKILLEADLPEGTNKGAFVRGYKAEKSRLLRIPKESRDWRDVHGLLKDALDEAERNNEADPVRASYLLGEARARERWLQVNGGQSADTYDWRWGGQDEWLDGVTLRFSQYQPPNEDWDHDHCEFCWAKFLSPDQAKEWPRLAPRDHHDLVTEGYTTTGSYPQGAEYVWICRRCFEDFDYLVDWVVVS